MSKYPVVDAKTTGYDAYLKANPNVAGMAIGGGLNDSAPDSPRQVIVNPYTTNLPTKQAKDSLIMNERIRHKINEDRIVPTFEITPEQKKWASTLGAYATNPAALKETIVARIASGDFVPNPTKEQNEAAKNILQSK